MKQDILVQFHSVFHLWPLPSSIDKQDNEVYIIETRYTEYFAILCHHSSSNAPFWHIYMGSEWTTPPIITPYIISYLSIGAFKNGLSSRITPIKCITWSINGATQIVVVHSFTPCHTKEHWTSSHIGHIIQVLMAYFCKKKKKSQKVTDLKVGSFYVLAVLSELRTCAHGKIVQEDNCSLEFREKRATSHGHKNYTPYNL